MSSLENSQIGTARGGHWERVRTLDSEHNDRTRDSQILSHVNRRHPNACPPPKHSLPSATRREPVERLRALRKKSPSQSASICEISGQPASTFAFPRALDVYPSQEDAV